MKGSLMDRMRSAASRLRRPTRLLLRKPLPPAAIPWRQVSFAQAGEDRIVDFVLTALGITRPSYLDIGAYHPYHLSNTALLHLKGGRGINVEPDPDSFRAFPRHRRDDANLNIGIGAEPGWLTFYRMSSPTLNTFSAGAAHEAVRETGGAQRIIGTEEIEVRTVEQILRESGTVPDFLSLDVEGGDLPIVRTMEKWPGLPIVVCVETLTYSEHGHGVKIRDFDEELARMGYLPYADTHINTIYVLSDRWTGH